MALLFDTHVQKMKYNVLREVARLAYQDALTPQQLLEIPKRIIPEGKPSFRCCIYKERAIMASGWALPWAARRMGTWWRCCPSPAMSAPWTASR